MKNRHSIKTLGLISIALGLYLPIIGVEKYLNYETNRQIESVEDKLDIVFQKITADSEEVSLELIEQYNLLDSDTEKRNIVNNVSETLGLTYVIFGIIFVLIGEHLRNYDLRK